MSRRRRAQAEEGLRCPKCGGTNIVKQGAFYQCQYTAENPEAPSCGYLALKEEFTVQQGLDILEEKVKCP